MLGLRRGPSELKDPDVLLLAPLLAEANERYIKVKKLNSFMFFFRFCAAVSRSGRGAAANPAISVEDAEGTGTTAAQLSSEKLLEYNM